MGSASDFFLEEFSKKNNFQRWLLKSFPIPGSSGAVFHWEFEIMVWIPVTLGLDLLFRWWISVSSKTLKNDILEGSRRY